MQGNGYKIVITAALLLLCGFYLFPSAQNYYYNNKLEALEGEAENEYLEENRASIQEARQESLKLGLDLLGGMHVTLEVQVAQFLSELAQQKDEAFNEALAAARRRVTGAADASIIELFVQEFEQRHPDARLARYFRSEAAGIDRYSSNDEVAEYLDNQADEAVGRAMEIVRRRVDQYGVTEPSIQRQGTRRIAVEMPGIENPGRIRSLLKGTARLEFRLMANPQALYEAAQRIGQYYEGRDVADSLQQQEPPSRLPTAGADTTRAPADTTTAPAGTTAADTSEEGASELGTRLGQTEDQGEQQDALDGSQDASTNPLLDRLQGNGLMPYRQSVVFAQVAVQDTAAVNTMLGKPAVQQLLPSGVELMYASRPVGQSQGGMEILNLLGVREDIELTGDVIEEASVTFDRYTNDPKVSMTMNSSGARTWSRLTGANIGKNVAVVLDRAVVSYPTIEGRIPGGRTEITGLENRAEAQDIVTVLKAGALPAPVEIVEERTVGPSLGQASIQAGLTSVLVGLLAVALFMIFYYHTAGVVADLALLLNLILILGILAGFGATLTLPGIAGIVLTIGMAVDANVLIYERIREEQATGKTLTAAIEAGYSNALSAILDANVTTFFVGAILYSFGVGPVQGFAVTLMAGILSSLFTAIIVTRVVFDYMVVGRRMDVSYG